jgi:hypothetical protein
MALITLADVIALNREVQTGAANINTTHQQAAVTDLIDKVGALFDSYTGRTLEAAVHTEYYDGVEDCDRLRLREYPVNSVASVYEDIGRTFAAATLMSSDLYFIDSPYIQLKSTTFIEGSKIYKVTYNAGYSTIPEDLKLAAVETVLHLYHLSYQQGTQGMASIAGGDGVSLSLDPGALLPKVKLILETYCPRVAL